MKMNGKAMGKDPLFNNPEPITEDPGDESLSMEKLEVVKQTISEMRQEVKKYERRRKNTSDEYMRMTFIIRRDLMDKLRDFCYTERLSQKEGLERILNEYLAGRDDLVKPRKNNRSDN